MIKHADNYNVVVQDEQGQEHLMHANQLQDLNLHHWQGWLCNAGVDYMYVTENGDCWGSQCQNDYLGNVNQERITLLTQPTVCRQTTCTGCTNDLTVAKRN